MKTYAENVVLDLACESWIAREASADASTDVRLKTLELE